jgi:hypothetical protein
VGFRKRLIPSYTVHYHSIKKKKYQKLLPLRPSLARRNLALSSDCSHLSGEVFNLVFKVLFDRRKAISE